MREREEMSRQIYRKRNTYKEAQTVLINEIKVTLEQLVLFAHYKTNTAYMIGNKSRKPMRFPCLSCDIVCVPLYL